MTAASVKSAPVTIWLPVPPLAATAVRSSAAETGLLHSATGHVQSMAPAPLIDRVAAARITPSTGAFWPKPRYCAVAADCGTPRTSRNARAATAVLTIVVRPSHLVPVKLNWSALASRVRALYRATLAASVTSRSMGSRSIAPSGSKIRCLTVGSCAAVGPASATYRSCAADMSKG